MPDPAAHVQVYEYADPKPAKWPEATFIVGNPPFIGNKRMRELLGDGYVEALRAAYPTVPKSVDLVMYWWEKAALKARAYDGKLGLRRFGLITTNSLRQTFNRRVLEPHLGDAKRPLSLLFAIPDHPWVDTVDGAAVRIGMTVAAAGRRPGRLLMVKEESRERNEAEGRQVALRTEMGLVFSNLRIGADVGSALILTANQSLAYQGVIPGGLGFKNVPVMTPERYVELRREGLLKRYLNGRELIHGITPSDIIDFFGYDESSARSIAPELFQVVLDEVKPFRDAMKREARRRRYWLYSEANSTMRPMMHNIDRYIATCRTAKHRIFVFLESDVLPDAKLIAIGLEQAEGLSILSSRAHLAWALATGANLGVGNDPNYNHADCFAKFPFPNLTPTQRASLRQLGEELDAHRKDRQATHPKLTLTQMYNVLEKLRAGEALEGKDKQIYNDGLIGILKDIHDRIDAEVAAAYGWPADLSENDILTNLVALNHEWAEEEARGHVRWLRPDYQNPDGRSAEAKTGKLDIAATGKTGKAPWPKTLPAQIAAVREALEMMGESDAESVARTFARGRATSVQPLLETLAGLGMAEMTDSGRYAI